MPRKASGSRRKPQARRSPKTRKAKGASAHKTGKATKRSQKSIKVAETRAKKTAARLKAREKRVAAREREVRKTEKEYKRRLRALESHGLYEPSGAKLTAKRKAEIDRRFRRFEDLLASDKYFYIPFPTRSKKERQRLEKLAKKNQLLASGKGIFVRKTSTAKSVKFRKMKSGALRLEIKKAKKAKSGKVKRSTQLVPIEPMGTLKAEMAKIKEAAAELMPLGPGESIAFHVSQAGYEEGHSHEVFDNPDELEVYLDTHYSQEIAYKVQFFRSITVVKTDRSDWFKQYPLPPKPLRGRAARVAREHRKGRF